MDNLDLLNNDLQVSPLSQNFLSEAAKWGKFLSVVGFIFCGFLAIAAFFMPAVYSRFSALSQLPESASGAAATAITVIYLVFSALLFFPCLYLNKFSNKMKVALTAVSQENFEDSFKNLKSLLKFYGIFIIVMLSFYVLAFIIGMLGAAMR
jgi:small-conductance mechanosensitive channel